MLADWLQGTHMYTLYTKYQQENASVSVGTLFFTGFAAAGLLGTFTGPFVDTYGRKRACLVYVALELLINSLEHFNDMNLLLVGRVLGGVSTSLLFSAFEAWMVTEHRRRGFPEEWIGLTFGRCAVWNGATAIVAGVAAQLAADWLGDIGPFQLAMTLTALAGVLMLAWEENYGSAAPAAKAGKKATQRGSAADAAAAAEPPAPPSGLLGAWHAVWQSEELMLVPRRYSNAPKRHQPLTSAPQPAPNQAVASPSPGANQAQPGRH
jgi:MFS family permease